jgi:hypothetical protein
MSVGSFHELVNLLTPYVKTNPRKLGPNYQPLYPELVAGIGIQYLGGTKMTDFDEIYGVSYQSA